ncbi:unnamed protein product [Timema podura]|uniref:DUF4789 domain-containing protein n=1 Tax=Timema podura TaxID=61482 RepID=A0ABN7NJZ0_TIMPD|nr:unnamed protein product [Timema podura]
MVTLAQLTFIRSRNRAAHGMIHMVVLCLSLQMVQTAVLPPRWADPTLNPCANQPGGWQLLHWPSDGRCYRIFQQGPPCPDTMELAPSLDGTAECRCPPGTAQSPRDALCHKLYTQGPCEAGEYLTPVPARTYRYSQIQVISWSVRLWGKCREPEPCGDGQVFWPLDERCYPLLTRGPCPSGKLLIRRKDGLPQCECGPKGSLEDHYWSSGQACYQHYTRGPCTEQGTLFLPGGQCGCNPSLLHYHNDTGHCFQIGSRGPCPAGHHFLLAHDSTTNTTRTNCVCKEHHILWPTDGRCYRPFTRGPCSSGQILLHTSYCTPNPCRKGRLYFPEEGGTCYKVGTRGPCQAGTLVVYETLLRGGISHRGVCGCSGPDPCTIIVEDDACEARYDGVCYRLYARGPCEEGQWLVPVRGSRERGEAKCECMPSNMVSSDNSTIQCLPPSVRLARFLTATTQTSNM